MDNPLTSVRSKTLNNIATAQIDQLLINISKAQQLAPLFTILEATKKSLSDIQTFIAHLLTHLPDKDLATTILTSIRDHIAAHPWETALFVTAIILILNPLAWVGFGAKGPIAQSLAAQWQTMIGAEVSKGSLFALLQRIGMMFPGLSGVVGTAFLAVVMGFEGAGEAIRVKSKL